MAQLSLRLQTIRPKTPWWPDEDQLGVRLQGLVERNLERGAPTVGVVARRDEVILVPLRPFIDAKHRLPLVLAGLARWNEGEGPPEAVGVMGRMRRRGRGDRQWAPFATVFLEWPDGRWWHWQLLLDADGAPLPDSSTQARAVDGLPRPSGLGGWWTLSRTRKPSLKLERKVPEVRSTIVQ